MSSRGFERSKKDGEKVNKVAILKIANFIQERTKISGVANQITEFDGHDDVHAVVENQ